MRKFKFSLQALLTVKEMELNNAEIAYAEYLKRCSDARGSIESVKIEIAHLQREVGSARTQDFHAAFHHHYMLAQKQTFKTLEQKEAAWELAEQEAQDKLKEFIQAKKAYNALCESKERKYGEYCREVQRNEESELEDVFNNRRCIKAV